MLMTRRVVALGAGFAASVGTATLILGTSQQAALKTPAIPKAGVLAGPRSVEQVGAPRDATLAAIPPDNPQTPAKIALGERLFFDGRLSADGTVACSTCHDPARAFTDGGQRRSGSRAASVSATRRPSSTPSTTRRNSGTAA